MILIVDNTRRRIISEIRDSLMDMGIPCAVSGSETCVDLLPSTLAVATEAYIFDDVKYSCSITENVPCVLCADEGALQELSKAAFGDAFLSYCTPVRPIYYSLERNSFFVYSKEIYFTPIEKRIISMLLLDGGWCSGERLLPYCNKSRKVSAQSIGVHVCNINKKTLSAVGIDIISCKRYTGYKIRDLK